MDFLYICLNQFESSIKFQFICNSPKIIFSLIDFTCSSQLLWPQNQYTSAINEPNLIELIASFIEKLPIYANLSG